MYKKVNELFDGGINADLQIEAEKVKDEVTGYCEKCGQFLIPKEGKIMKFDEGSEQILLCITCYESKVEQQLSHV